MSFVIKPEDKIAPADETETALYDRLGTINQESLDFADYVANPDEFGQGGRQGLYDTTLANLNDYNQRFSDFNYTGQLNDSTSTQLNDILSNQISNIDNYANEGVGSIMNQYANRGVLNSSATGKTFGDLGRNVQNLTNDARNNFMTNYMDAYNRQYDADFKNLLVEGENIKNEYGFMDAVRNNAINQPTEMWRDLLRARHGNQADFIQSQSGSSDAGLGQAIGTIGMMAMMAFSDRELKCNITKLKEADGSLCQIDGHQIYDWDWNTRGQELTGHKQGRGVIAQEVLETRPDAVIMNDPSGFLMVDYGLLFQEKSEIIEAEILTKD